MGLSKSAKLLVLLGLWVADIVALLLGGVLAHLFLANRPSVFYFAVFALQCVVVLAGVGVCLLPNRLDPRPGVCARCGYDLTGNESGRCPECGLSADVTPGSTRAVPAHARVE